jgi:predicted membrane-bound spermidine synthase
MKTNKYISIFLISFSLIGLELVWTRLFSAEFYYTFAFLVLSTAILGLGLGALSLRLFEKLNREKAFRLSIFLAGLCSLAGPIIVFQLGLDFSKLYLSLMMMLKLFFIIIILGSSFYFGGIAVSYLLKTNSQIIDRLYMADLIGASAGVLIIILIMNLAGTPATASLTALPIFFSAYLLSEKKGKVFSFLLIILSIILSFFAHNYLEIERSDRGEILSTHWDALSKIRVVEYNEYTRGIRIDNAAQSSVYKFGGDFDRTKFKFDINVSNLIHRFDSCVFLSLGAGGGVDVLHAIQEGATEVHAVEVNPYINYLMTNGSLAEYTGYIYKDPRVKVVTEDARTYVRRFENKFDIIYALSSNSYAALASGAFALAENYLFTKEAIIDYWGALSENGYMMIEHHFYIPRVVSAVIDALKEIGIRNPNEYFAVYNLPNLRRNVLLLSKQPLEQGIITRAFGITLPFRDNYIYPLYPAHDSVYSNLFNQIVLQGWRNLQGEIPIDISPTTDNRPFIAQMGMWENLSISSNLKILPFEFTGFPLSKLNLLVIIAVIILIIIPLNILPYKFSRKKLKPAPWLYFFFIGMGFMMVEIILIQKYTLFIGVSVYSLITILFTLLLFSGIGSRFSGKFKSRIIFPVIIIWIILEIYLFTQLTYQFGGLTLIPRILISVLFTAPLGFFMGMPFPKAGIRVGELIDWGFAVNGAASVLGSALIILVALTCGFQISLFTGGFCYLIAFLLYSAKNRW